MAPSLCEVRSNLVFSMTVWINVHLFRIAAKDQSLALTGFAARRAPHKQHPYLRDRRSRRPKGKRAQETRAVRK